MMPSARIQATQELLENIAAAPVPMDSVTGDYMRGRRYIGAKDRNEIAARIYNIMRARARLNWWQERLGIPATPRNTVIIWLMLGENLESKRVERLFDGSAYGPPPLDDEEKALTEKLEGQSLDHSDMPEAVKIECPPEHEARLRAVFGDDFAAEMEAMMAAAPLDIRTNIRLIARENLQDSLAKDGVETAPTPFSPWGLRVDGKAFLSKTKAFHKGLLSIQDEGSQLIALVTGVQPGMQVLDYCAGGGGKALALAGAMNNKGRLVAMDIDGRRLEKARPRFKKAGIHDIVEVRPLSEDRHRKWLRRQKGAFDVVLADVPCSGSGTWRRNPDMRWHHYGPPLEELLVTQAEILDKIAPAVKPGGRLVYATCSLFAEENEHQVKAFLERHKDFALADLAAEYPDFCRAKTMRLTPRGHNTDGFFAACFIRKQDAGAETGAEKPAETTD